MEIKFVGIDLGTTYSCISVMDEETKKPSVVQSMEGENTVPSVVRMSPDEDKPVAGRAAKDGAVIYADYTIQFVKSKIGKVENFEYGPDDDKHTTTPEEVSAEILKKVVADASEATGTQIKDVVITVPAYFGVNERNATKQAGIMAGLNVVDIVEEPTAAAFYYGMHNSEEEETICIFDLGGGTFDVTAMKIKQGKLQEITKAGNHDLGGKDWDAELINMVEEKFREETGYDEEFDSDTLQELQIKCEKAKIQLSATNVVSIPIKMDRTHSANISVSREEFDARTAHLLRQAIDETKGIFEKVEKEGFKIDKILLVGGSTFMPQVKEALINEFGITPILNEPNEAVAKGASIYCAWKTLNLSEEDDFGTEIVQEVTETEETKIIKTLNPETQTTRTIEVALDPYEKIRKTEIVRVAAKSFGIRVRVNDEPKINNLIKKDQVVPITFTDTFGTSVEDMRNVSIALYQSEIEDEFYDVPEDVEPIGTSVLEGLPAGLPKGAPVQLTIKLEEDGTLTITGEHEGQPLEGKLEENYASMITSKE